MISLSNLSKQYGRQVLFVDASFQLNPGDKVGLVGPNGSGKTTIFRMLVGEEQADDGDVSVPRRVTIGTRCRPRCCPEFFWRSRSSGCDGFHLPFRGTPPGTRTLNLVIKSHLL